MKKEQIQILSCYLSLNCSVLGVSVIVLEISSFTLLSQECLLCFSVSDMPNSDTLTMDSLT